MGGIIDFSTSCPWQLYTFSFLHLIASIFLFIFDACGLLFPTKSGSCVESEVVMSRLLAICLLYTGVIYGVLTYHNKNYGDMITRLSNFALHSAVALSQGSDDASDHARRPLAARRESHSDDVEA